MYLIVGTSGTMKNLIKTSGTMKNLIKMKYGKQMI